MLVEVSLWAEVGASSEGMYGTSCPERWGEPKQSKDDDKRIEGLWESDTHLLLSLGRGEEM